MLSYMIAQILQVLCVFKCMSVHANVCVCVSVCVTDMYTHATAFSEPRSSVCVRGVAALLLLTAFEQANQALNEPSRSSSGPEGRSWASRDHKKAIYRRSAQSMRLNPTKHTHTHTHILYCEQFQMK